MKRSTAVIGIIVIGGLVLLNLATFIVDQTQQALVVQLGNPIGGVRGPGLHFKIPFIQQVIFFEKRVLEYDANPAEILTQDKKNLVVDNFSKWRIVDPLLFYQSVRNVAGAQARLDDIIYSELRVELGVHTLTDILAGGRAELMLNVTKRTDEVARSLGVEVLDVRIKRADLPKENEMAVFGRMNAERERQAKRYRSEGMEQAQKIRSEAEKERTVILAEAYRTSQENKGTGDAEAVRIYAEAFEKNPDFYAFTRSLDAYKESLKQDSTLVLDTQSPFFKYLR
ncbi:MAG: protease modulator HflC [Deltaproteobacteria bacterium]|nr:protease modulator HflC [Deltaproteobacteria bacterium]